MSGHATTPDGLGGLFTVPNLAGGHGKTLFEAVSLNNYVMYTDLGLGDVQEKGAALVYGPLQQLSLLLVRLAVGLTWWLNQLTTTNGLGNAIGSSLSGVSSELNAWLLPTALAGGAIIAWATSRTGRSALNQVAWTLTLGVAAVAMATSGAQIVGGLDTGRQLIGTTVSNLGAEHVSTTDVPFKWAGADTTTGDAPRDLARNSGDALWRVFAVVPWCEATFGSQEACNRYGAGWLKLSTDADKKTYVDQIIAKQEGGGDSPTVRYIEGHDPSSRVVISLFALASSAGVVFIVGGLALTALLSWGTALLLLFLGVVFLSVMVIPGRGRAIGAQFLETILGLTLLSALTTGVLSGMLLATTATLALAAPLGWLPAATMALAVLLAAWKSRSVLERILLSGGASLGRGGVGTAMGLMAANRAGRAGVRALGKGAGAVAGLAGGGRSAPRGGGYGGQGQGGHGPNGPGGGGLGGGVPGGGVPGGGGPGGGLGRPAGPSPRSGVPAPQFYNRFTPYRAQPAGAGAKSAPDADVAGAGGRGSSRGAGAGSSRGAGGGRSSGRVAGGGGGSGAAWQPGRPTPGHSSSPTPNAPEHTERTGPSHSYSTGRPAPGRETPVGTSGRSVPPSPTPRQPTQPGSAAAGRTPAGSTPSPAARPAAGGATSARPGAGGASSARPAAGGASSARPAAGGASSARPAAGGASSARPGAGGPMDNPRYNMPYRPARKPAPPHSGPQEPAAPRRYAELRPRPMPPGHVWHSKERRDKEQT